MPRKSYKYIKLRAKEIIPLAKELINNKDYANLVILENEIGFRKKAAKILKPTLNEIKEFLKNKKNKSIKQKQTISKFPKKETSKTKKIKNENSNFIKEEINFELENNNIGLDLDERLDPSKEIYDKEDIQIHRIRPSSSYLTDTPNSWEPKSEEKGITGFSIEELEKLKWSEKFYYSLDDLIAELKKTGSGKSIDVLPGKLIQPNEIDSGGYIYLFPLKTSAEDIFENAKVNLRIANNKVEGRIAGITLGSKSSIQIRTEKFLGDKTEGGKVFVDDTAMYEVLRDLIGAEIGLKKSTNNQTNSFTSLGLNFEFAEKLINNQFSDLDEYSNELNYGNKEQLNNSQINFIKNTLITDISYLWGPPGTGKTKTLAFLINHLCNKGERTLICSNTNMAVDQVILKCAEEKDNKFVKDGKVVRIGKVSNEDLNSKYFQDVTIEGIAEKRSKELLNQQKVLINKKRKLEKENEELIDIYNVILELDQLRLKQKNFINKVRNAQSEAKSIREDLERLDFQYEELVEKYNVRKAGGGGLRALLGRTPETLKKDIDKNINKANNLKTILNEKKILIKNLLDKNNEIDLKISKINNDLKDYERSEIEYSNKKIKEEINSFSEEIQIIEKEIEDIKQVVINESKVIGTTLTKTYLKASDLNTFDNVIIDEASMCMLPAIFLAGSLATKRIIICGDFSQLSPICKTNNLSIANILGNNIFEIAKVNDLRNPKENFSMLDTQYRMNSQICSLIAPFMYENKLKTGKIDSEKLLDSSIIKSARLTIIDTSTMMPFSSTTNTGSKINPINALVARNLINELNNSDPDFEIGYCVPYKGQDKLLRAITNENLITNITSGTVHSFQGDEKDVIIYDTVEAISNSFVLGKFSIATHRSEEGAKVLNVAISRAKEHLVFIADLSTLDKKLPNNSFLRNVLNECQRHGNVIDSRSIVDLQSISDELSKSYFQPANINFELPKTGHVNEDQFFPLLYNDLDQAKEAIIIFSGFFTPKRIEEIIPILQKRISNGVSVKFVLPSNETNGSFGKSQPEACEKVIKRIRQVGIVVDQRVRLHQKAVLIDSDIVWHGSLNPLSYAGKTLESMMTCRENGVALQLAENLSLKNTSKRNSIKQWAEKENPTCPICGKATIFAKSRYGFYFPCEDKNCKGKVSSRNF